MEPNPGDNAAETQLTDSYAPSYAEGIEVWNGRADIVPAPKFYDANGAEIARPGGVKFAYKGNVAGLQINSDTGEISSPSNWKMGTQTLTYDVVVTYSDGSTDTITASFKVVDKPDQPKPPKPDPTPEASRVTEIAYENPAVRVETIQTAAEGSDTTTATFPAPKLDGERRTDEYFAFINENGKPVQSLESSSTTPKAKIDKRTGEITVGPNRFDQDNEYEVRVALLRGQDILAETTVEIELYRGYPGQDMELALLVDGNFKSSSDLKSDEDLKNISVTLTNTDNNKTYTTGKAKDWFDAAGGKVDHARLGDVEYGTYRVKVEGVNTDKYSIAADHGVLSVVNGDTITLSKENNAATGDGPVGNGENYLKLSLVTKADTQPEQTEGLTPAYAEGIKVLVGTRQPVPAPTFTDADGNTVKAPEGTTFEFGPDEDYGAWIDEKTGEITPLLAGQKGRTTDDDWGNPGKLDFKVRVTYPDRSTDDIVASFERVLPPQSDDFDPKYPDTDLTQGDVSDAPTFDDPATDEVESAPEGTKFEKTEGDDGITVDEETGAITVGDDVEPGEHKVVVEVTYPDGSTDEVEVTVNVEAKKESENLNPFYPSTEIEQGQTGVAPEFDNPTTDAVETMPEGTTFAPSEYYPLPEGITVDPNTGQIIVGDDVEPGTYPVVVHVTYPDGSTDDIYTTITVTEKPDSSKYDPTYTDTDLTQGDVSDAPTFDDPATDEVESAPEGTKFEKKDGPEGITVDEETGAITVGDDVEPGEHKVVVEVTYPDGSTDEVEVTVNVEAKKESENLNPFYPSTEIEQGQTGVAPEFDNPTTDAVETMPEGTTFAPSEYYPLPEGITVDPNTGQIIVGDDVEPGTYPVVVHVTYPDGSTDDIYTTITVTEKPDSSKYDPTYTDTDLTQGDVSDAPTFDDPATDEVESAPEGTKFEKKDGPEGITVDEETGALVIGDDVPAGEHKVVVEVTYPDGSTDEVEVTVNVEAKPAADDYNPQYTDTTLKQGERSDAPTFDDPTTDAVEFVPEGTTFGPNEYSPLPEGITVDPETGEIIVAEDAEPGRYPIAVDVTYPDGSKDTIYETITVVGPTDAENLTPVYTDVTVERGETAFVDAPTFDDLATDEVEFAPEGTKFTLKDGEIEGVTIDEETGAISSNATFASPADHVYEVLVTYPDGSTDTTFVTIHVVETPQVKLYQPAYTEVTVTQGDVAEVAAPVFTDEETGEERDMPEGTTFALK
ncbi:hypothetical protein D8M36_08410, partial [Dermabacter sp. HSID17554]